MYYPCSENKDADQLRGNREADLRLCFRLCKLLVFSRGGSFIVLKIQMIRSQFTIRVVKIQTNKQEAKLCFCVCKLFFALKRLSKTKFWSDFNKNCLLAREIYLQKQIIYILLHFFFC